MYVQMPSDVLRACANQQQPEMHNREYNTNNDVNVERLATLKRHTIYDTTQCIWKMLLT